MHAMNRNRSLITLTICVAMALAAGCADDHAPRVLLVASNNGQLGDTGRDTGVWMAEITHPYLALADSGLDLTLDLASPDGGDAPIDEFSVAFNFDDFLASGVPDSGDPSNQRFLESLATRDLVATKTIQVMNEDGTMSEATRHRFVNTLRLADIDIADYDAIYFAGGNGAMWQFPDSEDVHRIVQEMYESDRLVGAACHGTSALLGTKLSSGEYLVAGRRVTGFSTAEEQYLGQADVMPLLLQEGFEARGAIYVEAEPWQPNVVVDGRLITGQNPPSAAGVGEALADALRNRLAE